MQRVAQDWLVLDLTHGSGTALGIAIGLQFLPQLLFSLWGGVLADRYPQAPHPAASPRPPWACSRSSWACSR